MGVKSLATDMVLLLCTAAVADNTLTGSNFTPNGSNLVNESLFPAFCPPRVHLVKSARGHDAPGLEGSIVDGASEFFSPGWPFSAHAHDLGVQNLNNVVSIWTTVPSGIRMVKCCPGHDQTVCNSIGATGDQLFQFRADFLDHNCQIQGFTPISNFTTCLSSKL